jgi:hypothetical protein
MQKISSMYLMRQIVDFNSSPLLQTSRFLVNIIQPLTGKLDSHIKNSFDLKDKLLETHMDSDETMVSFDVEALYPSVPLDLALQLTRSYLYSDLNLEKRTKIPIEAIMKLLYFCVHNTYFIFNNVFYQQISGLPMGASISVILADIVMEFLESYVFDVLLGFRPKAFDRYIDDIFCICKLFQVEIILAALNMAHDSLNFTLERETSGALPFLDIIISKTDSGHLEFTVYRKPTHSGRYLNFFSNNPVSHKRSVVSSLFFRAFRICSNEELLNSELSTIHKDLTSNSYPNKFVTRIEKDCKHKSRLPSQSVISVDEQSRNQRICLPFRQVWSGYTSRICTSLALDLAHKPTNKLRFQFRSPKSKSSAHTNRNAVYKIECSECPSVYIGQSNDVTRRISEHERDIRLGHNNNSALALHANSTGHLINLDGFSIVTNESSQLHRRLIESFCIQRSQEPMNKHPGNLPAIYIQSLKYSS